MSEFAKLLHSYLKNNKIVSDDDNLFKTRSKLYSNYSGETFASFFVEKRVFNSS